MPVDRQICLKCGHVYAERHISGPEFAIDAVRSSNDSKMCVHCGGAVTWTSAGDDSSGKPQQTTGLPRYAELGAKEQKFVDAFWAKSGLSANKRKRRWWRFWR